MSNGLFITGTDTGVGKTIVTAVIGLLMKARGGSVGAMKPVQCGGNDAEFLHWILELKEPLTEINPCFAREALSPHIAFARQGMEVNPGEILQAFGRLTKIHDFVLVEGAGGLLAPIREDYLNVDLIKDLNLDIVVVARPGLGTINHTLLTVEQARQHGIHVRGVIFNKSRETPAGAAEDTNPSIIQKLGRVPILGHVPFLKDLYPEEIVKRCENSIDLDGLRAARVFSSKNSAAWDKKYVWHPFTQMKDWEPLVIERAEGCYLIDSDGHRYLDGVSSLWVNVHGHRKHAIDQALREQISRVSHSTFLGLSHPPAAELARKLVEIAPKGLEKVFYSDNGSTAVEAAIKIAYQYWQNIGRREKIHLAHLENSYHGDTLGSVSVGGIDLFHQVYKNLIFKTIQTDLQNFEKALKERRETIAAFVVEPLIQGAAGMLVWPPGVLKRMSEVCRELDVIFIADEAATGFGRTGKMFACAHEGVSPDILCLAKGLTGGYLPLAATLTTQKIFDGFLFDYKEQKTFFHGHTYTANPLACAAALANLEVFEKERTLEALAPKIKYLAESLKRFYNLPHVGEARQLGFMVGIELVKNRAAKEPFPWEEQIGIHVCRRARARGVILRPLGSTIVLMPPLSISMEELKTLLDVTYWAIEEVTGLK